MAISTDAAIEFFGTQDQVTTGGGSIADGGFSSISDATEWTNDDDAPMASFVLECDYTTAPTANTSVNLYAQLNEIRSTNDQPTPDSNYAHVYLGSFPLDAVGSSTNQSIAIDARLPNTKSSQKYQFIIENNGGQSMNSGWDLYVTPKTIGPHA
jgi:hypothetical protein